MHTTRKIQVVGNRSYAVSLPKKWVIENKLNISKTINIEQTNNKLTISANIIKPNDQKLEINIHDTALIPGILFLCYTKGIDELTLIFPKTETLLESKPLVLDILSHLEGFKISDENKTRLVINSFYRKSEIKVSKIAKRMTSILTQMVECITNSNARTKTILENELDCLYHLSKRTLYLCSIDIELMKDNDLIDIEDIFLWRLIFKKMENIGDIIEKTKEIKTSNTDSINSILDHLNSVFILDKTIDSKRIAQLEKIQTTSKDLDKIKDLTIDTLNNMLLIKLNNDYFTNKT